MTDPHVYLVTILGKYSRRTSATMSLDVSAIAHDLVAAGRVVAVANASEVMRAIETGTLPQGARFCIMGHPQRDVRDYLIDLSDALEAAGHEVIPGAALLRAHENKGVQGLIALRVDLPFVPQSYRLDAGGEILEEPGVVKSVTGAGSRGVRYVETTRPLQRWLAFDALMSVRIGHAMRLAGLWLLYRLTSHATALDRFMTERPRARFVVQQFVPGQSCDYKVLVFGRRIYVAQRSTRKNDFRASGSGMLTFPPVENALLDLAESARARLEVPFVSLDIIRTPSGFRVIEFQAVHFGPSVRDRSPHVHVRQGPTWTTEPNTTSLEGDVAMALHEFLSWNPT
jgi:glutathione synthase/RimK-type ligase-like ATP-grasp enzyme